MRRAQDGCTAHIELPAFGGALSLESKRFKELTPAQVALVLSKQGVMPQICEAVVKKGFNGRTMSLVKSAEDLMANLDLTGQVSLLCCETAIDCIQIFCKRGVQPSEISG
jgi:hypothetical protein